VLVVACVVAAGVRDVGEPRLARCADDEVADGGVCVRLVPGAGFLRVLAEGDVADVVLAVPDSPVLAPEIGNEPPGGARAPGQTARTPRSR